MVWFVILFLVSGGLVCDFPVQHGSGVEDLLALVANHIRNEITEGNGLTTCHTDEHMMGETVGVRVERPNSVLVLQMNNTTRGIHTELERTRERLVEGIGGSGEPGRNGGGGNHFGMEEGRLLGEQGRNGMFWCCHTNTSPWLEGRQFFPPP